MLCLGFFGAVLGCALGRHGTGCLGGDPSGEVDGQRFLRCAQAAAPSARTVRVGALQLTIEDRLLTITGAPVLRIAAFTGPVGAALEKPDLELLAAARPGLIFYLGGLGDDLETARQNLASLAALHVPTLFIAGGADRLPVVEAAFAALGEGERDLLLHASGLRELRSGGDRFVIVPGAPLGRYALDESSCGLTSDDIAQLQSEALASLSGDAAKPRTWLLSWYAPAGAGLSEGFGGSELGSPDLKALGSALGARGGLFAAPEALPFAGTPEGALRPNAAVPPTFWLVPRLSRVGSQRADGSRLHSQVASLVLTDKGLVSSAPTPERVLVP